MRFLKRLIERAAPTPVPIIEEVAAAVDVNEPAEANAATDAAEEGRKEKTRLRDILTCQEAAGQEKLAQVLALTTELSAPEARKILASCPCEVAAVSDAASTADFFTRHERENPQLWAPQTQLSVAERIAQIKNSYAAATGGALSGRKEP